MLNPRSIKKYVQNIFILYTLLFIVMIFVVYGYFFAEGKSFIWLTDGWEQHYKALLYYSKWLKDMVSNLWFHHSFHLPTYSFSIGYGSDIIATLHYYVIGDPLNLSALFVPASFMPYLYGILIIVRLYLAGISFLYYCNYRKKTKNISFLAGVFIYIFCSFALFAAVRHPYFVNPMIYLPLLLTGVEKILNERKHWIFIFSVTLSAVSNFYFFYALVLLTIMYVIIRLIDIYRRDMKKILKSVWKIGQYSCIGVLLSGFILLPVLLLFFSDTRSENGYLYDFLYPKKYYEKFLSCFITYATPGFWTRFGYGALSLPAIFMLFIKRKKNTSLKIAFILLTIFTLLPSAGHIFNGFSYVTNRWIWGYSMLIAYILTTMWEELIHISKKESVILCGLMILYAVLCRHFNDTRSDNFNTSLCIMTVTVIILIVSGVLLKDLKNRNKITNILMLLSTLFSIAANAYYGYSLKYSNYVSEFVDINQIAKKLKNTEAAAIIAADENNTNFYRYSGSKITRNATLLNGLSSTQYYWSLSNGAITDFFHTFHTLENTTFNYKELDGRTILNTLAGVKYYVTSNKDEVKSNVPYGYTKMILKNQSVIKNYNLYINQHELPLGYTYSSYLLPKDFEGLNAIQKQEAILSNVFLEESMDNFDQGEIIHTSKNIDYTIQCQNNQITDRNHSFIVTKKNTNVTFSFDGLTDSETYLSIEGLNYTPVSELSLYNDDKTIDPFDQYTKEDFEALSKKKQNKLIKNDKYFEGTKQLTLDINAITTDEINIHKKLSYKTPKYTWYCNRHNFIVNLGYSETAKKAVTINFPEIGIYTYDKIEIICQPMKTYIDKIEQRKQSVLGDINLHKTKRSYATDTITGTISLANAKILCLSIPYSKGWTAFVDGDECKLYKANVMYMALPLTAGEHNIVLKYHTPGLKEGILLTILGILLAISIGRKDGSQ